MKKYLLAMVLAFIIGMNFFFFYYYFPGSTLDGTDVSLQKRTEERTLNMEEKVTITAPSLHQEFFLLEEGFTRRLHLPQKSLFTLKPLHLENEESILYDETRLDKELEEVLKELPPNGP